MKRTLIRPISNKRQAQLKEYNALTAKLRMLCNNLSELSGNKADWQSGYMVEPHHLNGRNGKRLTDPFGIILITRSEHQEEQARMSYERKQELLAFIRPIRIKQGFEDIKFE